VSHVLVQFVIVLVGVGSHEQFHLQCLSEQHQRCWRMDCLWQAVQDWSRSSWENSTANGGATGPRNNQSRGRRRAKLLTCMNIRDSLKLTRQVLGCWAEKAALVEYCQPKSNMVSNPRQLTCSRWWAANISHAAEVGERRANYIKRSVKDSLKGLTT